MSQEAAVGFTFDPKGIMAGASKAVEAIQGINNRIKLMSNLALGYLGMKGIAGALPELGKTAGIAGDIIQRNLFWPLRQELAPILNKFLAWTRDHRAMFVKWGGYLVGVFNIIKGVVVGVWQFIQKVGESFSRFVEKVFGKSTRTIEQTMNLLLGKIAIVIAFIMVALEPLADAIGQIFGFLYAGAMGFFKGISDMLPGVIQELHGVTTAISEFITELLGSGKAGGMFAKVMEWVGRASMFVARILLWFIKIVFQALTGITKFFKWIFSSDRPKGLEFIKELFGKIGDAIGWVVNKLLEFGQMIADFFKIDINVADKFWEFIDGIKNKFKEFWAFISSGFERMGSWITDVFKKAIGWVSEKLEWVSQKWDALMDKAKNFFGGENKTVQGDMTKNIMANVQIPGAPAAGKIPTPATTGAGGVATVNNNYNVNLNVTEGNARAAGQQFNAGMYDKTREQLQRDRQARGRAR